MGILQSDTLLVFKYVDLLFLSNHIYKVDIRGNFSIEYWPPWITHIAFSDEFNSCVNNLPEMCQHISFGKKFTDDIYTWPKNLVSMSFKVCPLSIEIPIGIKKLEIFEYNNIDKSKLIDLLPSTIQELKIHNHYNEELFHLPNNLKKLSIGCNFHKSIDLIPDTVEELILGDYYKFPINKLPKSLIYLNLGKRYNLNIPLHNCPKIKKVCLGNIRQQQIWPKSIEEMTVHHLHGVVFDFPNNLKLLRLEGNTYTNRFIDFLPDTIETIIIGTELGSKISRFPKKCNTLIVPSTFINNFSRNQTETYFYN